VIGELPVSARADLGEHGFDDVLGHPAGDALGERRAEVSAMP
jgi:hypothetical protein